MRKFDERVANKILMRTKKDGTPAKKPGPKKKIETPEQVPVVKVTGPIKIETPEANQVAVVEKPEKPRKIEYKVTGIDTAIGSFQYFKYNQTIDWTDLNNETVSMNLEEWREFMKIFPEALKVLGVKL